MKTFLIPTDFTSASLQLIEETIRCCRPERVNIILFHAFEMPQSMQDIVGTGSKPHLQVMNERFRRGCKRIKEKYGPVVENIVFRHMYGNTVSVFKNYLQFNKVDAIVFPDGFLYHAVHDRSVDPARLIKKSKYPVISTLAPESKPGIVSMIDQDGNLLISDLVTAS